MVLTNTAAVVEQHLSSWGHCWAFWLVQPERGWRLVWRASADAKWQWHKERTRHQVLTAHFSIEERLDLTYRPNPRPDYSASLLTSFKVCIFPGWGMFVPPKWRTNSIKFNFSHEVTLPLVTWHFSNWTFLLCVSIGKRFLKRVIKAAFRGFSTLELGCFSGVSHCHFSALKILK